MPTPRGISVGLWRLRPGRTRSPLAGRAHNFLRATTKAFGGHAWVCPGASSRGYLCRMSITGVVDGLPEASPTGYSPETGRSHIGIRRYSSAPTPILTTKPIAEVRPDAPDRPRLASTPKSEPTHKASSRSVFVLPHAVRLATSGAPTVGRQMLPVRFNAHFMRGRNMPDGRGRWSVASADPGRRVHTERQLQKTRCLIGSMAVSGALARKVPGIAGNPNNRLPEGLVWEPDACPHRVQHTIRGTASAKSRKTFCRTCSSCRISRLNEGNLARCKFAVVMQHSAPHRR